jgi:hypothetical protein
MQNVKRLEIRIYAPTETKGLRFRIIGLSNSYISFDYNFYCIIDHALDILADNGYDDRNIKDINYNEAKDKYIVLAYKE